MEIYDSPGVILRPNIRMLITEAIEALLYRCVTLSPKDETVRQAHDSMFLLPRLAETQERRPHSLVRQRACPNRLQHHREKGADTGDIVRGIWDTCGGGGSAADDVLEAIVYSVCYGI